MMARSASPTDSDDGPRVLTVVSCAETKQDLDDGETVPARELYTSSVHVCKDKYGQHSHGYYIASAKFGLVHNQEELPHYDKTLSNMSDEETAEWAKEVASDLANLVLKEGFDAVVIIGGRDYVDPLEEHFDDIHAAILTPWQTEDSVTGVGRGMSWCNDEANWPVNVSSVDEIATIVDRAAPDYLPDELAHADNVDYDALLDEMSASRRTYMLPTTPDGEDEPWFDKLAAVNDAIRSDREIDWSEVTH